MENITLRQRSGNICVKALGIKQTNKQKKPAIKINTKYSPSFNLPHHPQISNDVWYIYFAFRHFACLFMICLTQYFDRMTVDLLCFLKGNMHANKHF